MIFRSLKDPFSKVFFRACLVLGIAATAFPQQAGQKIVRVMQAAQITDAVMISDVAVAGKTIGDQSLQQYISLDSSNLTSLSARTRYTPAQ